MTKYPPVDASLKTWNEVAGLRNWRNILIGNGASMAVYSGFGYKSLYNVAHKKLDELEGLSPLDIEFFEEADTENFEMVLSLLSSASRVCTILKKPQNDIQERIESIRNALFNAVRTVHVPWEDVLNGKRLEQMGEFYYTQSKIFTTNYDLLLYWSLMTLKDTHGFFLDFFQSTGEFDPTNSFYSDLYNDPIPKLFYLHGAAHIYRDQHGRTCKIRSSNQLNILSILDYYISSPDRVPLFVAEGTHSEKQSTIGRSAYLTFCLREFARTSGPLVVFGSDLGLSDKHLVNIIAKTHSQYPLAISIYRGKMTDVELISKKSRIIKELCPKPQRGKSWREIHFFDSTTHPLGTPNLFLA
ncbi:MAG: hypothetical protein CMH57_11590 [Myxococcales bacterium]|nr:hypothetical protein [Myxococcales bacterium]